MLNEQEGENGEIEPYHPQPGPLDETYAESPGDKVMPAEFHPATSSN